MVPFLAANSIEKKIEMQASIIVGNYEFYYAAGKLSSLISFQGNSATPPLELKEAVQVALETYDPGEDASLQYLVTLLNRYRPSENYDEQMAYLFEWGRDGKEPV